MNKADLVQALSERLDTDRRVAAAALDGVLDVIMETVASGDSVTILGFGTFERRERAARSGRNPRTGAVIEIPAASVPGFRAGAGFRNAVSGTTQVMPRRSTVARSSTPATGAVSAASGPVAVAAVPAGAPGPESAATNGAVPAGAATNGQIRVSKKAKADAKKEKPAKAAPKKAETAKSDAGKGGKKKSKK